MQDNAPHPSPLWCRLIDLWWAPFRFIWNALIFISIRAYGIEKCTFQNVKSGKYPSRVHTNLNLDDAKHLDLLLTETKELERLAHDRRLAITDKFKVLLTLAAALLTIIGWLLPKVFDLNSALVWGTFFCAFVFLFDAVFFASGIFCGGVRAVRHG